MHFNTRNRNTSDGSNADAAGLISVDTLKLDDHSRLTLTRKFKNIFHIDMGDTLAVYQGTKAAELFLNIQSKGEVTEKWRLSQLVENDDPSQMMNTGVLQMDGKVDTSSKPKEMLSYAEYNSEEYTVPRKSPLNIMVIDDEPDALFVLKKALSDANYNVDTFRDPVDAMNRFHQMNRPYYDLVITDIRMPKVNGLRLYQNMKSTDRNVKVLFISALDAAEELTSVLPGIVSSQLIKKPFGNDQIVESVNKMLKSS